MKSPITGGEVKLVHKIEKLEFRGEAFDIVYHNYKCEDTEEEFTTSQLDDLNLNQLHNKYRSKHKIPFPEDIISIRNQYGLSQTKMALILGFGQNTYRKYEHGDIPTLANANLIKVARDPAKFLALIEDCEDLKNKEKVNLINRTKRLINEESVVKLGVYAWLFGQNASPNQFNGYRSPSINKFCMMVKYFAREIEPHKTKLNKLLFYADYLHFQITGRSISGINYQAIKMGPVPNRYDTLFKLGEEEGEFQITYIQYPNKDYIGEKFTTDEPNIDADIIDQNELNTLELVKDMLGQKPTQDLIKMSHEEEAWKDNEQTNSIINYESAFKLKHINFQKIK